MKKIGFIDYYLDEWHSNNYPQMISEVGNGEFEVCYAYGKIDSPLKGAITNKEWAIKNNVILLDTIDKVAEKSDYIIVLSPDNPEMHEELCSKALMFGKNTYIDKTFAPDKKTAEKIFAVANSYKTKCYSASALYFADEYLNLNKKEIEVINSWGPGTYEIYSIHQIEPIVSIMGIGAKRIMSLGDDKYSSILIEYTDKRRVIFSNFPSGSLFQMNIGYKDSRCKQITIESDFFKNSIKSMLEFFKTGEIPISHEQTFEVIAIREAGIKALKSPFNWVEIHS